MSNKQIYIGGHLLTSRGFVSTAEYSKSIGANFYQIFLSSPQSYKRSVRSDKELLQLKNKLDKYRIKLVIHASYMLNFCNDEDSFKHKQAVKLLVGDLNDSVKLGAIGVVIHMGKQLKLDKDSAINNYVAGIKNVLQKSSDSSIIIFETGAGVGTEVCTNLFELNALYNRFTHDERQRIMFCIDTCHIFSAGYDVGNKQFVDIFDKLIKTNMGWDKVACVHLNNSKCPLNSKKDRHADLEDGLINKSGLKHFVRLCYKYDIPMVLETPCDSDSSLSTTSLRIKQINLVKKWCSL